MKGFFTFAFEIVWFFSLRSTLTENVQNMRHNIHNNLYIDIFNFTFILKSNRSLNQHVGCIHIAHSANRAPCVMQRAANRQSLSFSFLHILYLIYSFVSISVCFRFRLNLHVEFYARACRWLSDCLGWRIRIMHFQLETKKKQTFDICVQLKRSGNENIFFFRSKRNEWVESNLEEIEFAPYAGVVVSWRQFHFRSTI